MSDMRLVVAGAGGRMGRMLVQAIHATEGASLCGALEHGQSPVLGHDAGTLAGIGETGVKVTDDALEALVDADGLIDFTIPSSTVALSEAAAQARIVHVIGTTGLSADDLARIEAAARHAVVVRSGNMSLGVNLLAGLVRKVAATLGPEYDIEVVEMHHRNKIDAPSGTALMFGRAAADGRGIDLEQNSVRARDGHTGARPDGAIGFQALRGGTVVGDHDVIFAGPAERIVLSHRAEDRGIFARGAVRAALWGKGKKPGQYTMADVLGLSDI